jgi:hypothetical protein
MFISQEELDSAYAADADRLNDQRRLALEPNELVDLDADFPSFLIGYEGILGLDDEEVSLALLSTFCYEGILGLDDEEGV